MTLVTLSLAGCSGGDVSADDVRSKEKQIEAASQKLNGGQPAKEFGSTQGE